MQASDIVTEEALDAIYLALMAREADDTAKKAWANRKTVQEVLDIVFRSEEFIHCLPTLLKPYALAASHRHIRDTRSYYAAIAASPLSGSKVHELISSKCLGGDYYDFHDVRFQELHRWVAARDAQKPIGRLLEISTMPFTTGIWSLYLKDLQHLATVDLPAAQGGPSWAKVLGMGAHAHIPIDLDTADLKDLSATLTNSGGFDLITACEVVEHLQRDFTEIAAWMLDCLKPGGVALVSTPNALRAEIFTELARGRNPAQRFVNFNGNCGGHFHFREYAMAELVDGVEKAGGAVLMTAYSSCMAPGERLKEDDYHLRNLAVLAFERKWLTTELVGFKSVPMTLAP